MAELFGVFRSAGVGPEEREGFAAIRDDLAAFRPGDGGHESGAWFDLGTLARHRRDEAALTRTDAPPSACGWIGRLPDRDGHVALDHLATLLDEGRDDPLWRCEPRFAACAVDERSRTAWLVSDRYGYNPIYYACDGETLVFASKLAPLLRCGLVEWGPDAAAVADFFTFEHVTGVRTFAAGVKVLPPATVLRFADGRLTLRSYRPEARPEDGPPLGDREAAERLYRELLESVRRSLPADRRVGITLSGGMDSRALLHCAHALGADVATYTYGLPGCRDVAIAAELSRRVGAPHTVVEAGPSLVPRWLDHGVHVTGGMLSCIHYNILSMADAQEGDDRTILDGLCGDGILGGNLRLGMVAARSADRAVRKVAAWRFSAWTPSQLRAGLLHEEFARTLDYDPTDAIRRHFRGVAPRDLWRGCHRFEMLERWRRFTQYGPQMTQPLAAVETPFWGNGFMETASRLTPWQLFERRLYLRMYARFMRDLAVVPDSRREVPLSWPFAARCAKKALDFAGRRAARLLGPAGPRPAPGMTDYPRWFREDLAPFIEERLRDAPPAVWEVLRPDAVDALLREHRSGAADHTRKIGCLLTFAAWHRAVRGGRSRVAEAVRT